MKFQRKNGIHLLNVFINMILVTVPDPQFLRFLDIKKSFKLEARLATRSEDCDIVEIFLIQIFCFYIHCGCGSHLSDIAIVKYQAFVRWKCEE